MKINTRQIEVPIITKTVTQHACPLCGEWYGSEKQAIECYEKGMPEHRYAVGDVILVGHHPGDHYEKEYLIIDELMYRSFYYSDKASPKPIHHDDEPAYHCIGYTWETFKDSNVIKLAMTREEREKAESKARKLANVRGEVRWSRKTGSYEVKISV